MKQTRFMQVMFSAVERGDEELAAQVRDDIEGAKENGVVDTEEVTYTNLGEGKVMIVDKANGEATIAEVSPEEADVYDLVAVPSEELEKFLHPMECGNPNPGVVTEEHENVVPDHMDGVPVSQSMPDVTVMENACGENDEECEEEEERSYSDVNTAVLRIFHDQEFCERLFSEVIESEETTKVGDLKIEKSADEDQTVVVTDCKSGDQAKVSFDGDEIEITELGQKEFKCYSDVEAEEEGLKQYEPLFVVGIDPVNHVIVDSPVYNPEDAQILAQRLSEIGVIGVQIFQNPDEARAHAFALLEGAGVDVEAEDAVEEPVEKEFSDCSVYVTKYYSDCTTYMLRLFSEEEEGSSESQEVIEDAIKNGEQIENESEIVTPISDNVAVVEDKSNGEFTKAVLTDDEVEVSKISEEEADDLLKDVDIEDEKEEKSFSEISRYQLRLFSDIADQDDIEKALESGEEVENDEETITPLDKDTVIVEDKKTGELTKVEVNEDGDFDSEKISEEEADELTEEKAFSDMYCNYDGTKLFSEGEPMTEYMVRLFSEEANDVDVERAMATGDEVETENETIIPVDEETAIVEDKKTGELTKMVKLDSGVLEAEPISEEEAENLKDDSEDDSHEEEDVEEKEEEVKEKDFSDDVLAKFFSGIVANPAMQQPAVQPVAQTPMIDANGQVAQPAAPVVDPAQAQAAPAAPSVEVIEDKALQAVTAIQEAALAAQQEILAAKEAPVQAPEGDLREATFSDNTSVVKDDVLGSWLSML